MAKKIIKTNYTTWTGTSAKDTVHISGALYAKVNTGAGNDSVYGDWGWYDTINTGAGNDTVTMYYGFGSSLDTGSGNDSITLRYGNNISLIGGKGNDTIDFHGSGNVFQYASGDGFDLIQGFDATDTIKITGAKYSKKTSGKDVILTVGKGKITLKGAKGKTFNIIGTLDGGAKNINNTAAKKVLKGTSYADTIKNSANYVTIAGGAGNDKIQNEYGNNSSVVAGNGNDSVYNRSFYTTINGGAGKDTVYNYNGAWASINTGDGDDSIRNLSAYEDDGHYVTIAGGAGNDKIQNEYGNNASIAAGAGNDSIYNRSYYTTINGGSDNDTIRNFNGAVSSINGGAGNDSIVNEGDLDYASIQTTITGGKGNDSISLSGAANKTFIQYSSGDGNDVIQGFGATDTIKITGAKYSKKTSGQDVILTVGKGKITLKGAKGKTLNIDGTLDGKLSIPSDAYTYNGHSYKIYSNVANTWQEAKTYCEARGGHLAVINNAAENSAVFNYVTDKGYKEAYFGLSDEAKEGTWTWSNGDSSTYRNFAGGEPNGGTYENYAMFYTWAYPNGQWNDGDFNGAKEFICEWDTVTASPPTVQPAPAAPSGDVLEGTNGHDNLKNGTGLNLSKDAGKIIYGYDGNDTITNYANNVYISGGNGNDYLTSNYGSNATVLGGAGNDNVTVQSNNALIYGEDGNDTIQTYNEGNFVYGGRGDDYIYTRNNNNGFVSGEEGNDTIRAYKGTHLTLSGGNGNDSLWGGANSDTLYGGAGDDIFVYRPGEGTDRIMDFSGGDMLKILKTNGNEGGTFTNATFSGGSLTLAISGGGSVVLDNVGAGQSININGTARTISGGTLK